MAPSIRGAEKQLFQILHRVARKACQSRGIDQRVNHTCSAFLFKMTVVEIQIFKTLRPILVSLLPPLIGKRIRLLTGYRTGYGMDENVYSFFTGCLRGFKLQSGMNRFVISHIKLTF